MNFVKASGVPWARHERGPRKKATCRGWKLDRRSRFWNLKSRLVPVMELRLRATRRLNGEPLPFDLAHLRPGSDRHLRASGLRDERNCFSPSRPTTTVSCLLAKSFTSLGSQSIGFGFPILTLEKSGCAGFKIVEFTWNNDTGNSQNSASSFHDPFGACIASRIGFRSRAPIVGEISRLQGFDQSLRNLGLKA